MVDKMNSLISGYQYTDAEEKLLLKSITILVDTREKENKHVTDYFDKKGIKWINKGLKSGDYSFMIPVNNELGIIRDIYYSNSLIIERKNSLDELATNFTKNRDRFTAEFSRTNAKLILLIENASFDKMIAHNYRSQLNEKAFMASLFAFQHRYNINVNFVDTANAGLFIHANCYYFLKEQINK
jgi:ERCC4-type nuclease